MFGPTGELATRGRRDLFRNLYLIPIPHATQGVEAANNNNKLCYTSEQLATNAYKLRAVLALISYLHGCAGYPTKATWIARIEMGFYNGWPGLTASRVRKCLPNSDSTTMGYQKLIRQNIRPSNKKLRSKIHDVTVLIADPNNMSEDMQNMVAMDLPGRMPVTSATGYKYIFIMLDCDSNYVKGCPMKSRETDEMIRCYSECYNYYKNAGFTAWLLRLDNEVSKNLIQRIVEDKLDYQLAAPHDHRRNPAERAIQCYKNHYIAVMAGTDPDFPKDRWDLLLPHIELTLNLLRPSKLNPKISAYNLINGTFDFNKTPLAPAGTKTIVHDSCKERASWAKHGSCGFYIGPALHHFRCYKNFMVTTKSIRTSNTVEFFPVKCENHYLSEVEQINILIQDLITIVSNPTRNVPSIEYGDELNNALRTMQRLMCCNADGTQRYDKSTTKDQGVAVPDRPRPRTRSQTFVQEPIGTIVRKRFNDGKFYEGEITKFDPINKFYTVKFQDGDIEEYDQSEMKKYKKKKQQYANPTEAGFLVNNKYDQNIFFIPTKACPNPVKRDYQIQASAYLINHCIRELQEVRERANAASGRVWDDESNKMVSYRDLINHHNEKIRSKWLKSGENEFGRLFRGFPPNGIEGIGVLDWIHKTAVPDGNASEKYSKRLENFYSTVEQLILLCNTLSTISEYQPQKQQLQQTKLFNNF